MSAGTLTHGGVTVIAKTGDIRILADMWFLNPDEASKASV